MRRLVWTAAMFALTLGCVGVAIATKSVIPVFVAWLPLLVLVWALNRPDPTDAAWPQPSTGDGTTHSDAPSVDAGAAPGEA